MLGICSIPPSNWSLTPDDNNEEIYLGLSAFSKDFMTAGFYLNQCILLDKKLRYLWERRDDFITKCRYIREPFQDETEHARSLLMHGCDYSEKQILA